MSIIALVRDPHGAASTSYDLLVVGGGIYGAALTLEAARRGLSTLLVERDDFGGATSWNSLRIVHGGLRYLQSLDLRRHRESVAERQWLLQAFPDLVEPLPCLMPLYRPPRGGRLRRPSAFRVALAGNEALSQRSPGKVPPGRLLGVGETTKLFPQVDRDGLRGGALWYDAVVSDSHRLLIEMLRWACRCGARVLNYVEASALLVDGGRVAGLRAVDRETGETLELRAPVVVNCAGPWCREVARRFDRDLPELFRPVLAFNLLFDREPLSQAGLAVAAPRGDAQTWFLLPWKGKALAGTFYVPAPAQTADLGQGPGEDRIDAFLAELNAALPGVELRRDQIARVLWGWLPADRAGSAVPASRPIVHDHGSAGGPAGLLSVSGIKLTTARAVAEKALERVFALGSSTGTERPTAEPPLPADEILRLAERDREAARSHLRRIVEEESVVRLDDLLLRRTDWGLRLDGPAAARLCDLLGWAGLRPAEEEERLLQTGTRGRRS